MVQLSQLYGELRKQDIHLYLKDIGFSQAATIEYQKKYAIFLDPACFSSLRNMKAVLAHEIGHCATGCTHRMSSPIDLVERHEYKAERWAIESCLPFRSLRQAMQEGFQEPWQLAEYFEMPEDFIRRAIAYYTGPRALHFDETQDIL